MNKKMLFSLVVMLLLVSTSFVSALSFDFLNIVNLEGLEVYASSDDKVLIYKNTQEPYQVYEYPSYICYTRGEWTRFVKDPIRSDGYMDDSFILRFKERHTIDITGIPGPNLYKVPLYRYAYLTYDVDCGGVVSSYETSSWFEKGNNVAVRESRLSYTNPCVGKEVFSNFKACVSINNDVQYVYGKVFFGSVDNSVEGDSEEQSSRMSIGQSIVSFLSNIYDKVVEWIGRIGFGS